MLEPIDWRDEARLLRAAGRTPRQIAKMVMRSLEAVEEALREPRRPPKPWAPKPIKAAGDREPRKRNGSGDTNSDQVGAGRSAPAGRASPSRMFRAPFGSSWMSGYRGRQLRRSLPARSTARSSCGGSAGRAGNSRWMAEAARGSTCYPIVIPVKTSSENYWLW
jgi:hypothetical protein